MIDKFSERRRRQINLTEFGKIIFGEMIRPESAISSGKPFQSFGVTRFNTESYINWKRAVFATGTAAVVAV